MNFSDAFKALMGEEGGYSNDPNDPGGETMYGVTKRVAEANGYTGDMRSLSLDVAKAIAKKAYWDVFACDQLPYPIAFQVFDTAYNGGHPIKWLQEAVGVTADGVIGAATIGAVCSANIWQVLALFNASLLEYLASLKQASFADGRMNRIAGNLRKGLENGNGNGS
jgi:lysozyme family protein